jgi:hypothetical protein
MDALVAAQAAGVGLSVVERPDHQKRRQKKEMLNKAKVLLVVSMLAVLLVACTPVQALSRASAQVTSDPAPQRVREITVVGVGRVNLVPDIAKINVGVEARADTVAEAKAKVDRQMEAVTAALNELGVAEKDIQSSHYSIYYEQEPYPQPREEGPSGEPQGAYRVLSMLEVTVRDVEKAGQVLDGVVTAGANQVYGVSFTASDDQAWQSQAREKAMADARARALEFATLGGVELGEVLSISEVIGGNVYFAYAERGMGGGGGGIAPGELEMSTQVQVTFALQ